MTYPISGPKAIETLLDEVSPGAFPACICSLAEARFNLLALDINVVRRMPDTDDENYTLGIVPVSKTPSPDTAEIAGPLTFVGGTIVEHVIVFYSFVKDGERERGAASHSAFAEIVEHIVADDPAFKQGLGLLESTIMGQRKRMQNHYIRTTRYLSNEIGGNHLYMSATEAVFAVEKVR